MNGSGATFSQEVAIYVLRCWTRRLERILEARRVASLAYQAHAADRPIELRRSPPPARLASAIWSKADTAPRLSFA